jgi:hypothetical protein
MNLIAKGFHRKKQTVSSTNSNRIKIIFLFFKMKKMIISTLPGFGGALAGFGGIDSIPGTGAALFGFGGITSFTTLGAGFVGFGGTLASTEGEGAGLFGFGTSCACFIGLGGPPW